MTTLYKFKLQAHEEGLVAQLETWHSVYETECFYWCLDEWRFQQLERQHRAINARAEDGKAWTMRQAAKAKNFKVKRIAKNNSRFAFASKELAFDHLVMLKNRQKTHMERELKFISHFLSWVQEGGLYTLKPDGPMSKEYQVPGSHDLVHRHLNFDM